MQALRPGGPEVLSFGAIPLGRPGPGEVLVRHTAIGVNFIDVYQRAGLYPIDTPFVPGNEGAGVVEEVGEGVTSVRPGNRVATVNLRGTYVERRVAPESSLVAIPDGVTDEVAAAALLKGMTAEYLLRRTHAVGPGTTILFHAAAGGVGLIACQWAAALGATVIGTVGSQEKAALARANGCHHVIDYRTEDFVARVKDITGGRGVDVAYDSVGKDTFPATLDTLRPRGLWVSFGNSSGPVPPFSPLILSQKGSLFMTRPTLGHYTATRAELEASAAALFDVIRSGAVAVHVGGRFALADAADAHRALEARQTAGSTILVP
ncbi:MAG: quinone oxidoreductase [Bauldia sp.]|nr:quinone oxidoreductase [Bauldia sp.]